MLEWLLSSPATKHRTALLHYILHQLCGYAFSRKDAICLEAKPIKTRLQLANKAQRTSVLNGTALSSFFPAKTASAQSDSCYDKKRSKSKQQIHLQSL